MHPRGSVHVLTTLIFTITGCTGASKTPDFTSDDLLTEIDGYEDWDQPVGWSGPAPSCDGTHGPLVDIWTNPTTAEALAAGTNPLPDGATLIKQGYADDGVTKYNLTVMRKLTGFDADNGDWFWGQYDAAGAELASGAVSGCTSCHAASAGDYLLFPESPVVTDPADCP